MALFTATAGDVVVTILGGVLILLIRYLLYLRKLPPGPWGLPIVGSMLHLNSSKVNLFNEFEKYRRKYGNVFSVTVGSFNVVVINGHKLIREAFKQDVFNARPQFDAWKVRNLGDRNRGIVMCDGNQCWIEQGRFMLKHLKEFGYGKRSMEGLLLNELEHLITRLRGHEDTPVNMRTIFNASVLNSLWMIVAGRRFDPEDKSFQNVVSILTENLQRCIVTGPQFFFTWPARYGLVPMTELRKRFLKSRQEILNLLEFDISSHEKSYQPVVERDFIDAYLHQIKGTKDPASSFYGDEGRKNLLIVLQDLFVAGGETTSSTLLWSILHLVTNRAVQEKLFHEVESKIGLTRLPSLSDKPKLVYVEAFLEEILRHSSIVPFSVFHRATTDTEFEGQFVPKDSVIFANLHEAHHNKEYWGDPEKFRPERFLNADGTGLIRYEASTPFSTGKRVCPGEALARDTLFLFLTGLIQNFSFELDPASYGCYDPTATPERASFTMSPPKPFNVMIRSTQ